MRRRYLFCNVPYNLSDVPLGAFIPDIRYPTQDMVVGKMAEKDTDFTTRGRRNFKGFLDSLESYSLNAKLTSFASFLFQSSTKDRLKITARDGNLYELTQPRLFFRLSLAEPKVRRWLEEGIRIGQSDCYFVVGLQTFHDASVVEDKSHERKVKAKAELPVGEVIQANFGVSPGEALDAKISPAKEAKEKAKASFDTDGERIFAICYRKVKVSTTSLSDSKLDTENMWKLYSNTREGGTVASEVVQAVLDEEDIGVTQSDEEKGIDGFEDGEFEFLVMPGRASGTV